VTDPSPHWTEKPPFDLRTGAGVDLLILHGFVFAAHGESPGQAGYRVTLAEMNGAKNGEGDSSPFPGRLSEAEAGLFAIADALRDISDLEALIYLRSRGHACNRQVAQLVASWRDAESSRLATYAAQIGQNPDLINVEAAAPHQLRNFWESPGPYDTFSEATMLRAVEWCAISSFDPWWNRLARVLEERSLQGGIAEPAQAAYWVFNMMRSDYALRLMPGVLEGYQRSISIPGPRGSAPWVGEGERSTAQTHVPLASAIVFCHHRVKSSGVQAELLRQATDTICKHQDSSGGWPTWSNDSAPSIESTAMALHALALAKPADWPRVAAQGRDWLWSVQAEDGTWIEEGTAGPTHLTVLVLDAIELASDNWAVTFQRSKTVANNVEAEAADALHPQLEHLMARLLTGSARRKAIESYIEEVRKTGRRIRKTDIWTRAGYDSRTEFERWQRAAPNATRTAHRNICRVLFEKPHLSLDKK
jgi:hypothetical protein